ncbi:MAG TPA: ATP-binding protein [Polyangiaceae bacterium]|nr:ATP-binding protein [Polyangiaceae bacterium]
MKRGGRLQRFALSLAVNGVCLGIPLWLALDGSAQGEAERQRLGLAGLVGILASSTFFASWAERERSRRWQALDVTAGHLAKLRWDSDEVVASARILTHSEREIERGFDALARVLVNLREQRDRLGGILAAMEEGVLLLDAQGRIALTNPALREMLLIGPDAVGRTLLEVIRRTELKELFDRAEATKEPVSCELEAGTLKPRRLLVRVASVAGEPAQHFGVFIDVTEVRKLESMRRDFVANVSHELRTPVTAIRSAAETLQVGLPEDPAVLRQFIGIIDRNAVRLHDLVEDVLSLSHIESQKLRLNMEPLELRSVCSQVSSLFRERAERKQIRLENTISSAGARVQADRRALEHVLGNLVDNAVKYCAAGATVSVEARDVGESFELSVRDDGPGIEARHLPRIFERFYRVDAGRSRDVGGTGLGLSIVKHLVEAMGGNVKVESEPGRGTRFFFTLRKAELEVRQAVA